MVILSSLMLLAAGAQSGLQPETVHLRRMESVNPYRQLAVNWGENAYTYMDAADTTLAPDRPDLNLGGERTLTLRPGKSDKVLLQFGQLNRAVWRGSRVTDVKLVLHPVDGRFTQEVPVRVVRLAREWRDGAGHGEPMYWTATYNAAMGSPRGNAVKWEKPGAMGASDRASKPSLVQSTSVGYNAATATWTLSGPGLTEDVRYWLNHQYRNFGWVLEAAQPSAARGPVEFASSDAFEKALRPELVITFAPLAGEGERKGVDLNVTFIERTPRFLRYHDDGVNSYERKPFREDTPGIMTRPLNGDTQKWPKKGDMMTYTAHVKNSGFTAYSGPVDVLWRFNGKVIKRATLQLNLKPEQETAARIQLPWSGDFRDIRDEKLSFEVDPYGRIPEVTKNNNEESKYLKAKTWKYWVERTPYEYAKRFLTAYGSYSFEDYLKWHEGVWNETYLDKSRFDGLAPDGCLARITLDDFEVVADGRLGGGIHRLDDKPDFHFDGEWGTEWLKGDALKDKAALDNIRNFIRCTRILLEGSLLHEGSHQVLGAYDVYWSNQEPSEPDKPTGKAKVKDGGDKYITRGAMYAFSGLMGGDDTRPNDQYTENTGLFERTSIMGFNSNIAYRNGFYGEWQYDLPRSISVRLLAADGEPIPNAKVGIWQSSANSIEDRFQVADGLVADANGVLKLPDQDSGEKTDVTTATGHTMLKKNPFGRIDVVGENTTLLLRVEGFGQRDYRFLRVYDLNPAYWRGYHDAYVHDLQTQISPTNVDWSRDLAQGKAATCVLNPGEAGRLVDGDPKTTWHGGQAPSGAYIQVDLGEAAVVAAVRFVQSEGYGQFFDRFKIEVSDDPSFRSGVTELNRQHPYSFSLAMCNDKDVDRRDPSVKWVTYGSRPTTARYLRVTSLADSGFAQLSELQVFGAAGR